MIILRTGGLQRERQVRADVRGRQERGRARRGGRQRQECPRLQGTISRVRTLNLGLCILQSQVASSQPSVDRFG